MGDFSDKAVPLAKEGTDAEDGALYSKTDGGLTLTLSEVYANDQAIYLSMQLKSDQPFPDLMTYEVEGRKEARFELEYLQKYSFVTYNEEEERDSRIYGNATPEEYIQHPNVHQNFWYDGKWDFEIPITVDTKSTKIIELNDINEAGAGVKSVIKTPYELTFTQMYNENYNNNENKPESEKWSTLLAANAKYHKTLHFEN